MATKSTICVVIFVADVKRVARFYRELMNMTVATEDARHAALTLPGFELVIHGMHGEPEPVAEGGPSVREDAYLKVCLPVASIAVAREQAPTLGGFIKPPECEWEYGGIRACDGNDPEGNVIQVRVPV